MNPRPTAIVPSTGFQQAPAMARPADVRLIPRPTGSARGQWPASEQPAWREASSNFRHSNSGFRFGATARDRDFRRDFRSDRHAERAHTHSASLPPGRSGCETCRLKIWQ
jgi:hypothetical protein